MLYGNSIIINDFNNQTKDFGGACIQIHRKYLSDERNLMVLIAPNDIMKYVVTSIEKLKIPFKILQESQTTGFIDVDINNEVRLPNFIKNALKPFYNANEVVLITLLVSIKNDEDIEKFQGIATSNKIFVIDFKDIVTED